MSKMKVTTTTYNLLMNNIEKEEIKLLKLPLIINMVKKYLTSNILKNNINFGEEYSKN
jgi:hypothetical protein